MTIRRISISLDPITACSFGGKFKEGWVLSELRPQTYLTTVPGSWLSPLPSSGEPEHTVQ